MAVIYVNRSSVKVDLGDYKGAIEDCNAAIRLKPRDTILAIAYVNRGEAKSDLGDYNGSIEDCNTVIGLKPIDTILAGTYNVRGKAKANQGNNIDSIMDYNKAIQLEPDHPEIYYNRGVANAALGYTSEVVTDLKTALKLLEQVNNISKSAAETTRVHLNVRPDLKTDVEKAFRDLE